MSDLVARDATLVGGVVTGSFTVNGRTSADLERRAREVAAAFADGLPWTVEVDAAAVMNGRCDVLGWQATCEVTVQHASSTGATS